MKATPRAIKELTVIPGVGESIARDLVNIGITGVADLKGKDPEQLYGASNKFAGCVQDRCLLYALRCAVYYSETPEEEREAEKLRWWNWKDNKTCRPRSNRRRQVLHPAKSEAE